jgi:hypothetical protein
MTDRRKGLPGVRNGSLRRGPLVFDWFELGRTEDED